MRVLLVEDEKNLAKTIKQGLEEEGFSVDMSHDGEEGCFMAENYPYDAIVLDVMLPTIDGFTILAHLRKHKCEKPILMLTAKNTVQDKIKGLNTGADDYLPKPFDFDELVARIKALIRRKTGSASPVLKVADLEIDLDAREVSRAGQPVSLSAKEYNILEYLASRQGKVVSRTELSEHVYDMNFDLDSNVIDVYITYLRRKIDRDFDKKLIHTVRGAGYMLKE
ncbi:MAG: response regulator transcription factor [Nitrospirota bacterium]|nr:response regulator transcription factor [Nitrospirota bacterium]